MKVKTINFKHSAPIGDVMYSLPAIKHLCKDLDSEANIYLFLDRNWDHFENPTHHVKGLLDEPTFEMLKPLLEACPFVNKVEKWKGESIHVDLDKAKYRGPEIGLPHSNMSRIYFYCYPDSACDLSQRTFDLMDLEAHGLNIGEHIDYSRLKDSIIVNRTARNTNPYINYLFMYGMPVFFVGTLIEYEKFALQVPTAKYLKIANFLQMALAIGNCKLFVGNQSFPFSVAEQMKVPRVLEACKEATNVMPQGPNGYDFYTQEGLEYYVNKLMKA